MSNRAKGQSVDVKKHRNALGVLPEILEQSVLTEVYPDKNGSPDILEMQRYYGAVKLGDEIYRVKTTVKKIKQEGKNKFYSLEIQEMEIIEARSEKQRMGDANSTQNPTTTIDSISATKLLNNFEFRVA